MRRAPCPRCARPEGTPVTNGLPGDDVGRRAGRGDEPDFYCAGCGHEWIDGPLPPWWPPVVAEEMDPFEREIAARELDRRHEQLAPIAATVLNGPLEKAVDQLKDLGPDPAGMLDEVFAGLVVASDRVLQAEAVHAAVAVCRALAAVSADPASDRAESDARFAALDAAVEVYHRADREFEQCGHLDVLHPDLDDEDDEDDDYWIDDGERLRRLVAGGEGEELPAVGAEWDDWLADTAETLFDDGSSMGWVRHVWSRLAGSGLTTVGTELDLARAQVRLVALAVLRRTLLARLDGDDVDEWRYWVRDPGIRSFHLGVLAGIEEVEPGVDLGYSAEGETESAALVALVDIEAGNLSSAMRQELGVAKVFALTWASRYEGARYPLSRDAVSEAVNSNLTPEKHMTYEWVDGGMTLL
ncbi:hypothetical protein WIS52_25870 [Pseudonocardia nematodicida]|uniref:Uncharacterized protein n=1 Tax=Pseudonocardia nematodicida TaxID=1206997 RepID=A0ABV1KHH9_9PSEU